MGAPSYRTVADRQTSIQVQQSAYGTALPVVFGTNRIAANLVWFGNFRSTAITTTTGGGGKGLGGGKSTNTTYTYSAAAILALCEGPIAGIGTVWKDKDQTTLSALGLSLFTGTRTQTTWSFLSSWANPTDFSYDVNFGYNFGTSFLDQSINYSSTAYLAASAYDLGDAAQVPNHNFEVQGMRIAGSGIVDASPADIIPDVLSSQQFGLGFLTGWIDALSDYRTYCQANGLYFSPAYVDQRAGADCIQELCDASNSSPLWSGGALKVLPYGDQTVTGNGVTFTPNLTPVYDLTDNHFYTGGQAGSGDTGQPPIKVTRSTPADAYNRVQVQFRDRTNQYNQAIVSVEDQDAIEKYGLKTAPVITMDFVCDAAIAKQCAQIALQRILYMRNVYEFELIANFALLEPMDIVTLTDGELGMDRTAVRITKIEEKDHSFYCTAEDLLIGVAGAASYAHDDGLRWQNRTDIPCLDPAAPVIFELPADPSATGLSVGLAAGAQPGDALYGGCNVWLSLDGTNYRKEGTIIGSSRYGALTSALASHASGMDSTNTLSVGLTSPGQMISGSSVDVANGTTLIVVGGEYLAYQTATLISANHYNLTTLNRGLYGTTGLSHSSGQTWVRVDQAIAQLPDLDLTLVGETVYIKLTAFNIWGKAEQDLASATAYTYTITGDMKALETPVDFADIGGATKPANNATQNVDGANMIPDPLNYTGGWLDNSAVYAVLHASGRPAERKAIQLAFANNADGAWSGLIPVHPGETLFYQHVVKSDGGSTETCNASYAYFDAAGGLLGSVNLGGAPYNTSRTLASVSGAWTIVACNFTVPTTAAYIQVYVERPTFTSYSFFLGEPYLGRAAPGATVGAPSGTLVGSIAANDVASTIKSGGGVANSQVTTPAVVASAISSLQATTLASTTAFGTSGTTLMSITLTPASSASVMQCIFCGTVFNTGTNDTATIAIKIGGTTYGSTQFIMNAYEPKTFICIANITGITGSATINLVGTSTMNVDEVLSGAEYSVLEVKK